MRKSLAKKKNKENLPIAYHQAEIGIDEKLNWIFQPKKLVAQAAVHLILFFASLFCPTLHTFIQKFQNQKVKD